MFGMGYGEMLIVAIVAVLLFGRRLPEVARSLGQSYQEFRRGLTDLKGDVDDAVYSARSGGHGSRSRYLPHLTGSESGSPEAVSQGTSDSAGPGVETPMEPQSNAVADSSANNGSDDAASSIP